MAKKLNKNLVGVMLVAGMVLIIAGGMFVIANLPGQDPAKYAADAEKFRADGDLERATQSFLRAFAKSGNEETLYLVKAAECAMESGKLGHAREYVNAARVKDTSSAAAAEVALRLEVQIARLLDNNPQWIRVLEVAEQVVTSDLGRESAFAHHALGQAYINLVDEDASYRERGEEALKRANQLDPSDPDIVETLTQHMWRQARAKELKGDKAGAREIAKARDAIIAAALTAAAGDAAKLASLKQLQAQFVIEDGRADEGLAMLEELADASTKETGPHRLLGEYYLGRPELGIKRDLDKAERHLRKGLELNPKAGMLYIGLGYVFKLRRSEAGADAERAAQMARAEREVYEQGLASIERSDNLLRDWRNNQARILFIQELFLGAIADARQSRDEAEKQRHMDVAETWIEKLKGERNEDSPDVKFLQAHLYYARGDFVNAVSEIESAIRHAGPRASGPMQRLAAELYIKQRQWGSAADTLQKLLTAFPADESLYVAMGQVQLEQGRPAEAMKYLRLNDTLPPVASLKPADAARIRTSLMNENTAAISLRIEAYRQQNQLDDVQEEVAKLDQGTPEEAKLRQANVLIWQEKFGEAETLIREVLTSSPDNINAIRTLIVCYQKAGREDDARQFVDGLLRRDADNRAYKQFALMLMDEGDSAERDERLLEFIKEEPDELTRYISLASFYDSKGQLDKVREFLDLAEKVNPKSHPVVENQFRLALREKDWNRAEEYAHRHGELNIDGTRGKLAQGRLALLKSEQLRAEGHADDADDLVHQAIDLMRVGLEEFPSNSQGWTFLAQAQLSVDRRVEARETLRRALQIDPTNAYAHRSLAALALDSGDEESAMTHMLAAEKGLPNDEWIKNQLQRLRERDDPQKGIASREQIREQNPADSENLVLLARLYADAKVKRYDKAEEAYREALKLTGNDLALAREFARFLASPEVNKSYEADSLLQEMLKAEEDMPKKALIAASLGQFYEQQNVLATADRHYAMAVSFDPSREILSLAAEFFTRTRRYAKAIEMFKLVEERAAGDERVLQQARSRIIAVLLASGELEDARERLDQYLAAYPDDPQGLIFEGAYHRVGGDIDKAEAAFNARLAKEPENAVALWQRGQVYMLRGRWLQAIDDLKKAKSYMPDGFDYQHRIALADALLEAGKNDEALAELRMILDQRPEEQAVAEALIDAYFRCARYGDAESLIYQYIRRYPREYRWPMLLAQLGRLAGDVKKSVAGLEKAAEVGQHHPQIIAELFSEYRRAEQPEKIVQYAVEKLSPEVLNRSPLAMSSLAWAFYKLKQNEKCFGAFNAALQSCGDSFPVYSRVIGDMVSTVGPQVALQYAQAQSDADPQNLDKLRALVHLLKINDRTEDSLAICDKMESLASRDSDIIFVNLAKGMLLTSVNRHEEARACYEKALQVNPDQPMVLNNLAFLLGDHLKRPDEAIPYARHAVRLSGDNADFLDTLGWLLYQNKQVGEARGMLLRALDHDRDNVAALYHLGVIYKETREEDDARARLMQAREHATRSKDPNQLLPKIEQALKELGATEG